jgi:hypothetical protein
MDGEHQLKSLQVVTEASLCHHLQLHPHGPATALPVPERITHNCLEVPHSQASVYVAPEGCDWDKGRDRPGEEIPTALWAGMGW